MSKLDISFTRYNGHTTAEELWLFDVSPFQNYQSSSFGTFLMLLLEAMEDECRDEHLQVQHEYRDELITYFKNCMEANRKLMIPLENIRNFLTLCRKNENLCNVRTLNLFWTLLKHDVPRSRHLVDYGLLNIEEFIGYRSHFTIGDRRVNTDKLMSTMEFITSEKSDRLYITDTTYCNDLVDMCYAYLYQLFSMGRVVKTCKNCGKQFISKHGEEYCSRISPQDSSKLCCNFAQSQQPEEQTPVEAKLLETDEVETVSEVVDDNESVTSEDNNTVAVSIDEADVISEQDTAAEITDDNTDAQEIEAEQQEEQSSEQTEAEENGIEQADDIEQTAESEDKADNAQVQSTDIVEEETQPEDNVQADASADNTPETVSDTKAKKPQSSSGDIREDTSKLHRQIYMRKQMLVKRNPDNKDYADAFEQYKADSKAWKKDVKSGEKTQEQYLEWLMKIREEASK